MFREVIPLRTMLLQTKRINPVAIVFIVILVIVFVNYGAQDVLRIVDAQYTDQHYYKLSYDGVLNNLYFERGYLFITSLFKQLGFSYLQFKLIAASAATILIYFSIGSFNINYCFVLFLYFISSFQTDLEQSRCFFAMSLVIYAMRYLLNQGVMNTVKYSALIIIAGTIHTVALFFLVLLLCNYKKGYNILNLLFPIIVVVSVPIKEVPQVRQLIISLIYFVTKSERVAIFLAFTTGLGFYACVIMHGALLLLFNHYRKMLKDHVFKDDRAYNYVRVVYRCLQLLSLAIPLYIFSTEFLRMFRSLFIMFYVAILICAKEADDLYGYKRSTAWADISLIAFVAFYNIVFNPISITSSYYRAIMSL